MKNVINLPINFFARVRSTVKFTSCNDLKSHKIMFKSGANNLIELFQLCTGSLSLIFKFIDIYKWAILENIHTQPRTASMF